MGIINFRAVKNLGWLAAMLALALLVGCSSNSAVRFAYVATDQGIYAFRMNAKSGAGSLVFGSPFVVKTSSTAATSVSSVVVHPSNNFLYAASQDTNSISLFKIDSTTGALTEVMPRTQLVTPSGTVGLSPAVLTMDKGGNFLFVGNQVSNDVWAYSIASSGALTFVSSAPLGSSPTGLTLDPSGNFLYVPVPNFSTIYVIGVSSGTLTSLCGSPGSTQPCLSISGGIGVPGIDPGGKFLYVPNPANATVTVLLINPSTPGILSQGPGAFGTGTVPLAADTNPTGAYLYVANNGAANLSEFQVDSHTGALTVLTTSTVSTGGNPTSIINDPDAKFIFVTNQAAQSVSEFTINSNGTLVSTGNVLQLNVPPRAVSVAK